MSQAGNFVTTPSPRANATHTCFPLVERHPVPADVLAAGPTLDTLADVLAAAVSDPGDLGVGLALLIMRYSLLVITARPSAEAGAARPSGATTASRAARLMTGFFM